MKTTIEIADGLLEKARKRAEQDGTTLREVVQAALRHFLGAPQPKRKFKLKDGSFKGNGLQPGVDIRDWDQIRGIIYEGRGG